MVYMFLVYCYMLTSELLDNICSISIGIYTFQHIKQDVNHRRNTVLILSDMMSQTLFLSICGCIAY